MRYPQRNRSSVYLLVRCMRRARPLRRRVFAGPLIAQAETTLYVANVGGSNEQLYRQKIIPPFEKAHNVKIVYVAGNSSDTLAKLQAQKGHQQINVAVMDDGPMYQAMQMGLCAKVDGRAGHERPVSARAARPERGRRRHGGDGDRL